MTLPAFKAYDIRGRVPDELNEEMARHIGVALAAELKQPGPVVIGHDIRLTSPGLHQALAQGLRSAGREVIDIGLCGTEEVYFQTAHLQAAGGAMVTASHNPMDYNGVKLVREQAKPISSDTGLFAIRDAVSKAHGVSEAKAPSKFLPDKSAYIDHLLHYVDKKSLKPLKLVVNSGNGGAGKIIDLLAPHLPLEFIRVFHEPDGRFPNGIPNPLLPENRQATADAVRQHQADMGIAWDGDFDRCFFFDHSGQFIEGYYLVGLLAKAILAKNPGGKVVHDPRLTWNTIEMVEANRGIPVLCKSGHAFIKEKMRAEDAVYGGEMSAHHYFREFTYADSGMIPWLLIAEQVSTAGKPLAELVAERIARFPCSGEINFKVQDAKASVSRVMNHYSAQSPQLDHTDGISADFGQWRFNLRSSNTEPLLRLNLETRADLVLLKQRTNEISQLINA